ncbi:hypothetical protein NPIL_405581 [Nephila pilipes]|uniref:Uncharacterized protein n=1 Tax=Nephila pilipes TaxID=299642 RepID=A0A8X6PGS8_NEPPI|nr:hypothetical protein NPIL_405581 [Nephila pilipes]
MISSAKSGHVTNKAFSFPGWFPIRSVNVKSLQTFLLRPFSRVIKVEETSPKTHILRDMGLHDRFLSKKSHVTEHFGALPSSLLLFRHRPLAKRN